MQNVYIIGHPSGCHRKSGCHSVIQTEMKINDEERCGLHTILCTNILVFKKVLFVIPRSMVDIGDGLGVLYFIP